MKTENEIKALPLEEQQKLVIELRAIKPGDKAYPNAKAIIEVITSLKKWEEPETVKVKNVSGHSVTVDDRTVGVDEVTKVYPWQYLALARFFEVEAGVMNALEEAGEAGRKKDAEELKRQSQPLMDIGQTITDAVAKGLATAPKVAALLLFGLFLMMGSRIALASMVIVTGGPGQYTVQQVAGLNGGTNNVATNTVTTYTVPVTNTISITTNANWSNVNNQWTNQPTYVTNVSITVPGLIPLQNYDQCTLSLGGILFGAAAGTVLAKVDYSPDAIMFQTNKWSLAFTPTPESTCTNLDVAGINGGYLRLSSISGLVTTGITNLVFEVTTKPTAHGP